MLPLIKLTEKTFKVTDLNDIREFDSSKIDAAKFLQNLNGFVLAARSCDGTYHTVYSEIREILSKHADALKKGSFLEALDEIDYADSVHGQRFVIHRTGESTYLLGDVISAMKQLAGRMTSK